MASKDYNIAKKTIQDDILDMLGDLRKTKHTIPFVAFYSYHSGANTILDVTGSGELYTAYLHCSSVGNGGAQGWMKITVDGEEYLAVTFNCTDETEKSYKCHLYVYAAGFQRYGSSNGLGYFTFNPTTGEPVYYEDVDFGNKGCMAVGTGETTVSYKYEAVAEHAAPNPIRFTQSLKIETYNGYEATGYANALYSLDE